MKTATWIRPHRAACTVFAALFVTAHAETLTLNLPASPVAIAFDSNSGPLTATVKATGMVGTTAAAVGDTLTVSSARRTGPLRIEADITTSREIRLSISLGLDPASGDVTLTLGGDPATDLGGGISFPPAFFPEAGPVWSGEARGRRLTVPANSFKTYRWE